MGLDRWLSAVTITLGFAVTASSQDVEAEGDGEPVPEVTFAWDRPLRGLAIRSGPVTFHVGGWMVLDGVKYSHANERDSGLELHSADLIFDLKVGERLTFLFRPDLVGVDTPRNLTEAWAAYEFHPALRLKAGQFRVPLGSELGTWEEDLPLVGRGFPSYLDGRTDVGVIADGRLFGEVLFYEAAAVAGHGFDLEGNRHSEEQFSLRGVLRPLAALDVEPLRGLYGGLGLAWSPDYDSRIVLATPMESIVFRTADLDGRSAQWIHLEGGWQWGPFRLGAERIWGEINDVALPGGGRDDFDQLTSWSATAAWRILGADVGHQGGGWAALPRDTGDLDLAARYSNADIDRSLFDEGLTTYDPSTQEVRTFTLSLGWSPTMATRVSGSWVRTIADDDLSTFGGTKRDSAYVLRFDVRF